MLFLSNCGGSGQAEEEVDSVADPFAGISLSSEVPHDVSAQNGPYPSGADSVSLTALATFAWQEFIALNYPADPSNRGQAKPNSSLGDAAEARVWETYWHKVEMFPYDQQPNAQGGKPIANSKPVYKYDPEAFKFAGSYGGGDGPQDSTLWNNLDENNELNVDEMFAHGVYDSTRIIYQAKINATGFQYILDQHLYLTDVRNAKTAATVSDIQNVGASCGITDTTVVSLPCGEIGGSEGNIEIKSAWRRLAPGEDASKYYTNKVIRYQAVKENGNSVRKWFVETYALIGLHIIHKTENFPSFIYATFEHNDNLASGLYYIDEITQTSGGDDTAGDTVKITQRDNPIPQEIANVNTDAHQTVAGTVWENYQLIGVQAYPIDYSELDQSDATAKSTYFLANLVIESNSELQNFRGTKAADGADNKNMYAKGRQLNMGGCMGCHGVAELQKGGDFNFLITNSPFTSPEIVGDEGVISLRNINNYGDVQKMFDDYVGLNGIHINASPHKAFWDTLSYDNFINGKVPNVGVKICECGNSKASAIVQILQGAYESYPEMPAGGPYFPQEQVDKFAEWIDKGCPN